MAPGDKRYRLVIHRIGSSGVENLISANDRALAAELPVKIAQIKQRYSGQLARIDVEAEDNLGDWTIIDRFWPEAEEQSET